MSSTAYGGKPGYGMCGFERIQHMIPYKSRLRNGRWVHVGPFRMDESEWSQGRDLMNMIIREGRSWPFDQIFETNTDFRAYFLSHTALVVRSLEDGIDLEGKHSPADDIMGMFYIKPNFPGRCSHICNGGFITAPQHRQQGVANLMGRIFLQCARDLGYRSVYFNLVFKSNEPSVHLWESLGFQRVAVLEEAAQLNGLEYLDTAYGYRYDLTKVPDNYLASTE